jgi:hypothetical protein
MIATLSSVWRTHSLGGGWLTGLTCVLGRFLTRTGGGLGVHGFSGCGLGVLYLLCLRRTGTGQL